MVRSQRLRVFTGPDLSARVVTVVIDEHVPATRADCPPKRCGHVRCRFHLATVEGPDRAGRRVQGRTPATTLRPQAFLGEVCALRRAEAYGRQLEPMPIAEVAEALGVRDSQVYAILATALEKLRTAGVELDRDDWPRAPGFPYTA